MDELYRPDDADWAHEMREPEEEHDEDEVRVAGLTAKEHREAAETLRRVGRLLDVRAACAVCGTFHTTSEWHAGWVGPCCERDPATRSDVETYGAGC